ncbi:MAG TPA: protein kinase [Gemmatimonadales bacterium]|jgi:serine/threonine-protein kinase
MPEQLERLAAALADRYRIERELGGGGMSRVFAARELDLNRDVVIKVLSADVAAGVSLERFGREIQLAASLQQANIVPLLSAGNAEGVPFYTMPLVHGESLRARLAQGTPSLREIIGILRDVARALSYAHARGVVHRDIKPDNVLLSHGAAVVTDFGIAKALSASRTLSGGATLTQAGSSIGTPAYMAPEQVAGDPAVDHRADLYAWGCLGYELLAGEPPFVRDTPQRLLAAHLSETPRPIAPRRPDVPAALARLVMRCLEKDPAARPADADEVLRQLEAVPTPTGSSGGGAVAAALTAARSRRGLALAAGVLLMVAIAAVMRSRNGPRGPGAGSAPVDHSIAVLPLANLSGDRADDYFGIGLSEEITRALAKAGVRVIGRVSAGALLARGLDERAIARELGVGSLLTGSVQRARGQLRISVALSAADGTIRWTQAYDRPISNVFAVQDEIARQVSRELLGSLGAAPGTLVRTETADPEAHSLLLQGIVLWNRRTGPAIRQAIALIEKAVARDPGYARAQAWLAMASATLPFYAEVETDSVLGRALAAADKALAIDSTVAEAYAAAGMALMTLGRNGEADARFRRALTLDSALAPIWGWSGILELRRGDLAAAQRRIGRAIELEPASLISRVQYVQAAIIERRYAAADSAAQSVIALDSSFALAWLQEAEALAGLGRADQAIAIMERRIRDLSGVRPTEVEGVYAWILAHGGRTADARAVVARLRAAHGGRLPPVAAAAAALEELGDHEAAVELLGNAVRHHDPWLWYSRKERYDRLRADPRVAALLAPLEAW